MTVIFKFSELDATKQISEYKGETLSLDNFYFHNRTLSFNSLLSQRTRNPTER